MANDLAAMVARISAEMVRPDLAGTAATGTNPNANAIRLAIATAISEYQKERFDFMDSDPAAPMSFPTVAQQAYYPVSAISPGKIFMIDYVQLLQGNTVLKLRETTPAQIHQDIQVNTAFGLPDSYAYEKNTLIFYPVPDQVYTVNIGGQILVAAPATDNEAGNMWMTDAELLIRCRAKYEVYTHVLRNEAMSRKFAFESVDDGAPDGETYKAYKSLKRRTNKITGLGRVRIPTF